MPLTQEIAQRMIVASHERAGELGISVSTAIVDAEGRLFAFGRMDGAHWISVDVSQAKAFTAALFRRDGAELAERMNPAFLASLTAMHDGKVFPAGSVTPVREGEVVVAGVGCSGGTDEQDGECAHAARAAFATS